MDDVETPTPHVPRVLQRVDFHSFIFRPFDPSKLHDQSDQSQMSSGRRRKQRKRHREHSGMKDQATNTDYSSNGRKLFVYLTIPVICAEWNSLCVVTQVYRLFFSP